MQAAKKEVSKLLRNLPNDATQKEIERRMAKKAAFYLLVVILFLTPVIAASSDGIPNALLRVTVQQKTDGKIGEGFHVLELSCWDSNCSLSSVSLNRCMPSGSEEQAFYPKVQYSSTSIGNLKARNEGNSIVVQETGSDIFGDYMNNLRFDYEPVEKDEVVTRLTGFSGGYVKNSAILKKIITTDYIPL